MASFLVRDASSASSIPVLSWENLFRLAGEARKSLPVQPIVRAFSPESGVAVHELAHWYKTKKWRESSAGCSGEIKKRLLFARQFCKLMGESLDAARGDSAPVLAFRSGPTTPYLVWLWLIGYLYTNGHLIKGGSALLREHDTAVYERN